MTGGRREPSEEELLQLRVRAKTELRKRMRAVRGAVPAEARRIRSERACDRLMARPEWNAARVVAGYVAMRSETDPRLALERGHTAGKTIVLPRIDYEHEIVELRTWDPLAPLEESGMGFLQPAADRPRVAHADVDLVIVPALAVDARGFRLGWGKGYYDRLLPLLGTARSIAMVFHFQLMAEVPEMPHDVAVDVVVSDQTDYETGPLEGD
jgi:5-formyltetrahydrofolate cyclo-ligase